MLSVRVVSPIVRLPLLRVYVLVNPGKAALPAARHSEMTIVPINNNEKNIGLDMRKVMFRLFTLAGKNASVNTGFICKGNRGSRNRFYKKIP